MKRFLLILGFSVSLFAFECGFDSSYYAIKDTKKKKAFFFDTLHPMIVKAQEKIKKERALAHFYLFLEKRLWLDENLKKRIAALNKKYRIKKPSKIAYDKKIDTIPTALVLAQAAAESGWGSSRFVKEANNIFGEWTWGKKGLIPSQRDANKTHKIRIFDTLQDSIDSYMLNLNRHYAYKSFREARYKAKQEGKTFTGKEASKHLHSYSGIGDAYKNLLRDIIHYNKICEYSLLKSLKKD